MRLSSNWAWEENEVWLKKWTVSRDKNCIARQKERRARSVQTFTWVRDQIKGNYYFIFFCEKWRGVIVRSALYQNDEVFNTNDIFHQHRTLISPGIGVNCTCLAFIQYFCIEFCPRCRIILVFVVTFTSFLTITQLVLHVLSFLFSSCIAIFSLFLYSHFLSLCPLSLFPSIAVFISIVTHKLFSVAAF